MIFFLSDDDMYRSGSAKFKAITIRKTIHYDNNQQELYSTDNSK